jgi:hypothetical protein
MNKPIKCKHLLSPDECWICTGHKHTSLPSNYKGLSKLLISHEMLLMKTIRKGISPTMGEEREYKTTFKAE